MEDNYAHDLYLLVKNGSAWLVAESLKLMSSFPLLKFSRTGKKISEFLDTISLALLTEEGSKYGLPMLLALAYFIFPLDAIPDFVIPIGLIDDCAVLAGAAKAARGILKRSNQT